MCMRLPPSAVALGVLLAGLVSYTWVARSRSGSSSFTALALNKPSSSSSSSSSSASSGAEDTPFWARPLSEWLGHWDGHTDPGSQESGA